MKFTFFILGANIKSKKKIFRGGSYDKKNVFLCFFILLLNVSFARELIIAGVPEKPNRWVNSYGDVLLKEMKINGELDKI